MDSLLILANGTICLYRFRKELIAALAEYKQVYVSAQDDGFAEELKAMGVIYIETPCGRRNANPIQDFILFCRYLRMMMKIRPATVLTYTIKPNIYGNFVARLLGIPVISTVSGLGDGFRNTGVVGNIVKWLYRFAFKKVSTVVFQNPFDEDAMRQAGIIKNQRVVLVHGSGVNLEEHNVLSYPDKPQASFLYMGRIMHTKGIYELINATRRLKSENVYDFTVNLMGFSEEDANKLVEEAEREQIISSVGFQKDLVPFIEKAQCVVLPSYSEGMSNALLEAAAHGRTLIATDISGCREVVEDGVNGFLCLPKDADSLYDCMKRFLVLSQEQRMEMGLASRKKVENEFNREIVVNTMLNEIAILEA